MRHHGVGAAGRPAAAEGGGAGAGGTLASRALRGSASLAARQVLVHGMGLAAGVLLARMLSPGEFGLFGIVTFLLGFLLSFGDAGLAAGLIRQRREPRTTDYRAVFTVQQLLVFSVVLAFWLASPKLVEWYRLPGENVWLFRLIGLSLLATSFQTIPTVRLERHLDFGRLAVVEVAQAVVFNGLAVGLVWAGYGPIAFGYALLARSVTGAVLANVVSPWPIGWRWAPHRIRPHLRFGLAFQGISLVSLLKDSITPVFVGMLLGTAAVGYLNWAIMFAAFPVLAVMALQRVYLPAFSRMREQSEELAGFVERVIGATNMIVAPLASLTLVLAAPLTPLVFGAQWIPALPFFYLFWVANLFVPTATPVMGLLNALGHSGTAFRFSLLWMLGTWAIGAPLVLRFGAGGYALANLLVQLTNVLLYRRAQRLVSFRVLAPVLPPWAAAIGGALAARGLQALLEADSILELAACGLLGAVAYLLLLAVLHPAGAERLLNWLRTGSWHLASR